MLMVRVMVRVMVQCAAAVAVDAEVAFPDDICPRTSPGGFCVV